MTDRQLAAHWENLRECEAGGAHPRVYRQLLEAIKALKGELNEKRGEVVALNDIIKHWDEQG